MLFMMMLVILVIALWIMVKSHEAELVDYQLAMATRVDGLTQLARGLSVPSLERLHQELVCTVDADHKLVLKVMQDRNLTSKFYVWPDTFSDEHDVDFSGYCHGSDDYYTVQVPDYVEDVAEYIYKMEDNNLIEENPMKRKASFKQRLNLMLGAKQNQRPPQFWRVKVARNVG